MRQIVLASKSPRRKELMEMMKLDFLVSPSSFEEKEGDLPAAELAIFNALGKAQQVAHQYKNALVIGVDTVVHVHGHILGKPRDRVHAAEMLRLLSGTTHEVITGLAIHSTPSEKTITTAETTLVTMDRLDESDIAAYIASGEGEDKAAGYAIQGLGSLYIQRIEGDYFNVVGLPVNRLRKILKEFGIKSWI